MTIHIDVNLTATQVSVDGLVGESMGGQVGVGRGAVRQWVASQLSS